MRPVFLYWLMYRVNGHPSVVIQPAASLVHARLKASMAGMADDRKFTQGHELDPKTAKRVPKAAVGHCLSQQEATKLLKRLAA
jgi:hypothetical protein